MMKGAVTSVAGGVAIPWRGSVTSVTIPVKNALTEALTSAPAVTKVENNNVQYRKLHFCEIVSGCPAGGLWLSEINVCAGSGLKNAPKK